MAAFALVLVSASASNIGDGSTWCDNGPVGESYPNTYDRTEYFYCKTLGTAVPMKCPPGTGFVRNNEVMGCVNWSEWGCTYKGQDLGRDCCTSANTRCSDPNPSVYWQCQSDESGQQHSTPRQCPAGMGYIDHNGTASCIFWDKWFSICQEIQKTL